MYKTHSEKCSEHETDYTASHLGVFLTLIYNRNGCYLKTSAKSPQIEWNTTCLSLLLVRADFFDGAVLWNEKLLHEDSLSVKSHNTLISNLLFDRKIEQVSYNE